LLLGAQTMKPEPGARVRIVAPTMLAGRVEGTVIELTRDSLLLSPSANRLYRLPLASVTSLEIRQRSRAAGAKKFGLWFGVAGLPMGALIGSIVVTACDFSDPETVRLANNDSLRFCPRRTVKSPNFFSTLVAFTVTSAAEGALLGALIGGNTWQSAKLPLQVSASPTGARIGTSIRF
jgi:hypothetical protein